MYDNHIYPKKRKSPLAPRWVKAKLIMLVLVLMSDILVSATIGLSNRVDLDFLLFSCCCCCYVYFVLGLLIGKKVICCLRATRHGFGFWSQVVSISAERDPLPLEIPFIIHPAEEARPNKRTRKGVSDRVFMNVVVQIMYPCRFLFGHWVNNNLCIVKARKCWQWCVYICTAVRKEGAICIHQFLIYLLVCVWDTWKERSVTKVEFIHLFDHRDQTLLKIG